MAGVGGTLLEDEIESLMKNYGREIWGMVMHRRCVAENPE